MAAAIPAEASSRSHLKVDPGFGILLEAEKTDGRRLRAVRDCGNGEKKEENKSMRQCVMICGLLVPVV